MLLEIKAQIPQLSKRERKLAEWVLIHASDIPSLSIKSFSERAGVSQPTIVRFCQHIQCKGYGDFKIKLSAALARGETTPPKLVPLNPIAQAEEQMTQNIAQLFRVLTQQYGPQKLEQTVQKLVKSRQIWIMGDAASQGVASLAAGLLLQRLKHVQFCPPSVAAESLVNLLHKNDAIIAIQSHEYALNPILQAAKKRRVCVVVLGPQDPNEQHFEAGFIQTSAVLPLPTLMNLVQIFTLNRILNLIPLVNPESAERLSYFDAPLPEKYEANPHSIQGELWPV